MNSPCVRQKRPLVNTMQVCTTNMGPCEQYAWGYGTNITQQCGPLGFNTYTVECNEPQSNSLGILSSSAFGGLSSNRLLFWLVPRFNAQNFEHLESFPGAFSRKPFEAPRFGYTCLSLIMMPLIACTSNSTPSDASCIWAALLIVPGPCLTGYPRCRRSMRRTPP